MRSFKALGVARGRDVARNVLAPLIGDQLCALQLVTNKLLQQGEILPGIKGQEFSERRDRVMDALPDGSALLVSAAPILRKAGVIPYPYRQSADYLYLTGCTQPGGAALLQKARSGSGGTVLTMYMPTGAEEREVWDGHVADPRDAEEFFGASEGRPMHELGKAISQLAKDKDSCLFADSASALVAHTPALTEAVASGNVRSSKSILHRERWVKSPVEIGLMRKSADVITQAMKDTMAASSLMAKEGEPITEQHLAAHVEFGCLRRGAQQMAFPSVVGAGPNSCIIHYSRLDEEALQGDCVLMDAGCELHGYCSDVTRVWSAHGPMTEPQREVYESVLEVAQECIQLCVPGHTLREIHQHSVRRLSYHLVRLGLFPGQTAERVAASGAFRAFYPTSGQTAERLVSSGAIRAFYPTSVGHWLGLDTHDCDHVGLGQPLVPGVVLTIEPGLYLPRRPHVPKHLQGIGVRIEDDIVITEGGHEVLTGSVPKDMAGLESLLCR